MKRRQPEKKGDRDIKKETNTPHTTFIYFTCSSNRSRSDAMIGTLHRLRAISSTANSNRKSIGGSLGGKWGEKSLLLIKVLAVHTPEKAGQGPSVSG